MLYCKKLIAAFLPSLVLPFVQMVAAFTRGDVKLEVEKGGKFEFFGGNISGEFEELVSMKERGGERERNIVAVR